MSGLLKRKVVVISGANGRDVYVVSQERPTVSEGDTVTNGEALETRLLKR